MKRKDWDSYYIEIAKVVAKRSTCNKKAVGAVLVKDNRILGTGYNGAPIGLPHCTEVGCLEVGNHCLRSVHAEINAIIHCAHHGVSTFESTLYTTCLPCWNCALALINAGIKKVVYVDDYKDDRGDQVKLLKEANINIKQLKYD